jgi:eukaryotic-like serine/threonine-protein kinase
VLSEVKSFGSFRLDTANHCLWRDRERVSITPKAYDVLCLLVENSGRLVTPDEMLEAIWAGTYVNPEVLRKYILEIRKALGDKSDDPRFVETVPKRGYRFIAPVSAYDEPATTGVAGSLPSSTAEVTAPTPAVEDPEPAPVPNSDPPRLRFPRAGDPLRTPALPTSVTRRPTRSMAIILFALAILIVGLLAVAGHSYLYRTPKLTDKDTIVLGEFTNTTGDPVFDDTLKTALTVSLNQSPFLNVVSDSKVAATLKLMTRPVDTTLTPDVVSELCQRAGSKAYLAGSISSLGSEYVLELKAVDCRSGDTLAQEQATAEAKEKVLAALGNIASKLRSELGESLATVEKLDVPLSEATTSSLEALKAYSFGEKVYFEKGPAAAVPDHQRAVQLDPNFAMGYRALGADYDTLGELGRASEYYTKAFELREHSSEREKLFITTDYYSIVTGELDKAAETYLQWIESYPRDSAARGNLGLMYTAEGEWEKAAESFRESLRLAPDGVSPYANLSNTLVALQQFDEARRIIGQAQARNLDSLILHNVLYALAFLASDSRAMGERQQWFAGKPEMNFGLSLSSDTEAYAGRLGKARELTKQSVDSAIRADSKEAGAIWQENAALREAAFGHADIAKRGAAAGIKLAPGSPGAGVEAALAYAMAGDTAQAESLAQGLNQRYRLDTQMQSLWLPAIRAQMALNRKNSLDALKNLQAAAPPIEFGSIEFVANGSCLYPTYIRGQAYLAARQGTQARAEFQKILDHGGIVWNCWTGALARLGVARANALEAGTSKGGDADSARQRALANYKDFLALWKDADSDIPIYQAAKAEYARLQ